MFRSLELMLLCKRQGWARPQSSLQRSAPGSAGASNGSCAGGPACSGSQAALLAERVKMQKAGVRIGSEGFRCRKLARMLPARSEQQSATGRRTTDARMSHLGSAMRGKVVISLHVLVMVEIFTADLRNSATRWALSLEQTGSHRARAQSQDGHQGTAVPGCKLRQTIEGSGGDGPSWVSILGAIVLWL